MYYCYMTNKIQIALIKFIETIQKESVVLLEKGEKKSHDKFRCLLCNGKFTRHARTHHFHRKKHIKKLDKLVVDIEQLLP